jgi:hypothetical protein
MSTLTLLRPRARTPWAQSIRQKCGSRGRSTAWRVEEVPGVDSGLVVVLTTQTEPDCVVIWGLVW